MPLESFISPLSKRLRSKTKQLGVVNRDRELGILPG